MNPNKSEVMIVHNLVHIIIIEKWDKLWTIIAPHLLENMTQLFQLVASNTLLEGIYNDDWVIT